MFSTIHPLCSLSLLTIEKGDIYIYEKFIPEFCCFIIDIDMLIRVKTVPERPRPLVQWTRSLLGALYSLLSADLY